MATLTVNNRWLFLHVPKCGGTAIRRALKAHGFSVKEHYPRTGHVRLNDVQHLCGVNPESLQVVAVIRNPYARELSHWLYEKTCAKGNGPDHRFAHAARHETVNSYVSDPLCKFTYYYEQEWYPKLYQPRTDPLAFIEQTGYYRYWLDYQGNLPRWLRVLRLENIDAELSEVMGRRIHVERANQTRHGEPLDYFDEEGKAVVRRLYWWSFREHYLPETGEPRA